MVKLNGDNAISGQTLFDHGAIVTAADSDALIVFYNQVRLRLAAKGELAVDFFADRISGSLPTGTVSGYVPPGVSLELRTSDASIVSIAPKPLVFTLHSSECQGTMITVNQGEVELRSSGRKYTVLAGESFSTVPDSAGQSTQSQVSKKEKLGLFVGIGTVVALMLAVALGSNDTNVENPGTFGGCVIVPSPGSPNTCS